MSERTKISVAVITYNQQDTIRQTLDSILMQKGDFDLELVIGEDCSQDNTYAICAEYVERYPKIVKLLPNTQNLGIMANFARVIKACTGEFIADIAGDDYYCDEHAIAKQLRHLQAHSEVGVIAANGYLYYTKSNKLVEGLNPVMESEQAAIKSYYFSPTHMEGAYFAPVGIMYRTELLRKSIDFEEILHRRLPVEDYPVQAILSQHTRFACLPDLLVVYRVYKESSSYISYNHPRYLEYYKGLIETRRYINELFPDDETPETVLQEQLLYKEFLLYLHQFKYDKAKQLVSKAISQYPNSGRFRHAARYTCTWFHFFLAHCVKEYKQTWTIKKITK